jgi:nucleotide-binding universal stress UspA family protein
MTGPHGIVVGVDGSDESRHALNFALDQARARSTTVHVITAYYPPHYWAMPVGMPIPTNEEEITQRIHQQTQALVDELLTTDPTPPKTDVTTVSGSPTKALLAASHNAELLVVGHRGRGALTSTTLGSVALHCVLHAHCPITVVRPHHPSNP